ncbi:unnamed protein product, partial [Prorocentrum cordatum]
RPWTNSLWSATFAALCGASTAPEAERRGRAESCHLREAAPRRAGPPSAPRTATARSAQREPLRRASPSIIEEGEEEEQEEEEEQKDKGEEKVESASAGADIPRINCTVERHS